MLRFFLPMVLAAFTVLQAEPLTGQSKDKRLPGQTMRGKEKAKPRSDDGRKATGTGRANRHPLPPPTLPHILSNSQFAGRSGVNGGLDIKSATSNASYKDSGVDPTTGAMSEIKRDIEMSGMPLSVWASYGNGKVFGGLGIMTLKLDRKYKTTSYIQASSSHTHVAPFFGLQSGAHVFTASIHSIALSIEQKYTGAPPNWPAGTPLPEDTSSSTSLYVGTVGYAFRRPAGIYGIDLTEGKLAKSEDENSSAAISNTAKAAFYARNEFGPHSLNSRLTYNFHRNRDESGEKQGAMDVTALRLIYGFNFMPGSEVFGGLAYFGRVAQELDLIMPLVPFTGGATTLLLIGSQFALGKAFSLSLGFETFSGSHEESEGGATSSASGSYTGFNCGVEARF